MSNARAMTLLNSHGDITLIWEEGQDALMLSTIEKKMAEGVTFFVIEPRLGGIVPPTVSPLAEPSEALRRRAVSVSDPDFAKLVGIEGVAAIKTPEKPIKTVRRAKSAQEVVTNETVAVRPARGG